nr:hypothetical protein [Thermoguttaceae bacterium]
WLVAGFGSPINLKGLSGKRGRRPSVCRVLRKEMDMNSALGLMATAPVLGFILVVLWCIAHS